MVNIILLNISYKLSHSTSLPGWSLTELIALLQTLCSCCNALPLEKHSASAAFSSSD